MKHIKYSVSFERTTIQQQTVVVAQDARVPEAIAKQAVVEIAKAKLTESGWKTGPTTDPDAPKVTRLADEEKPKGD